uniref:Uncharacterized protein n=2 Tax=viral metagenome TaxID=1070528 RepID=A0A6H1ZM10_9ZZZZ
MATRDMLKRLVPAMAALADAVLDGWIADAVTEMNVEEWPALVYPRAACYLAGHLYLRAQASAGAGQGVGAVTSEGAGGMSRGYGSVASSTADAEYMTTAPGAEYVRLRKAHICTPYPWSPDATFALR